MPLRLIQSNGENSESNSERQGFEACLSPVLDRLWSFAQRLAPNSVTAEDLLQETVLKAHRGFDRLKEPGCFKAWIFQILYHEWISQQRREARRPFTDLPLDEALFKDHRPWSLFDFQQEIPQLRDELARAFQQMAEPFRQVIWLKYVEGFDYEEMAAILGVAEGTVASRLCRARALLKEQLWNYAVEIGWVKHDEV